MRYETAREILIEASKKAGSKMSDFQKELDSGRETERILKKIKANHADASKRSAEESALAEKHKSNKILKAHHAMRAEHFAVHARNYAQHHANALKAHKAGDYRRAYSEGSYAADAQPHLRDIPHHVDYHNAGYYNK